MTLGIIISPAKKMNVVEGPPFPITQPALMAQTRILRDRLLQLSYEEARDLWRCSDRLAQAEFTRLHETDLDSNLTAASLAYEGIQYQHLAPQVMSENALRYLDRHLRILSGMYGVVRPSDGVIPYRLEMQARLAMPARDGREPTKDLYVFWGDALAQTLACDFDTILNVASVEYAKSVMPYLPEMGVRIVTCIFGSIRESDGRLLQRSTEAKAARGTFVRWCAENGVEDVDGVRSFGDRGYRFDTERSSSDMLVFVR